MPSRSRSTRLGRFARAHAGRLAALLFVSMAAACPENLLQPPASTAPAAPTALAAVATSPTQINLTWTDNSTNEDGFRVERAPGGTTTFTEIATVAAGVTTYQSTGLAGFTAYSYRVRAYNASGTSSYTGTADATTQVATPTAPSGLTANGASATQVNLAWTDNSGNEDGFRIERSPTGTTGFVEVATVGAGVVIYQNTGLTPSTGYTYRVRAYNTAGNSAYSNSAAGFTSAQPTTPPGAPTGLTATAATATQINLSWTDNSTDEDGFRVERAPGGTTTFTEIGTVGAGVTTYQNTGLTASTAYSYRVRAYNGAGNSAYTGTANATTPATPVSPPSAPSTLTATAFSTTQINLAWADNSNNEDGFKVERAPGGTTTFAEIATVGAGITTYQSTGLTASTAYDYRVRAYNSAGNSAYTSTASATTQAPPPPSAPSNLQTVPINATEIDLTWNDNSNNEDGFRIERAPDGTTSFVEIGTVGPGIVVYANNTGLTPATIYVYRIRAYNGAGTSGYSNTASGSTTPLPPSAPTALSATPVSSSQINLAWTDNSSNETGFYVERAPGGTTTFALVATLGAGVTSYQNTGLAAATSYAFRVRAANTGGYSGFSNEVTASTQSGLPAAPSGLVATASTTLSSVIQLTWTDNSSNETEFRVEEAVGAGGFVDIGAAPANSPAANIVSRAAGTTYSYRVRAHNAVGYSAYSNTASATTLTNQVVVYASAANALQAQYVNGVQDNTYSNTVYSMGKIGAGCNVVIGATSVAGCLSSALQFSGFGAAVAGRTITAVYLRLYASDLAGDFNAVYAANAIAAAWSPSTITFNNVSYYSSPETLHAPPQNGNPVDFDITAIAQAWVSGTVNNGVLVRTSSTGGGPVVETTFFWSDDTYNNALNRPQLIIQMQ